jgi:hypothetical protein
MLSRNMRSHVVQVVCPFRSSEEKAAPLKQMGDLGQVRQHPPAGCSGSVPGYAAAKRVPRMALLVQ